MAFSKITLNGTTLMDVTQDTVDEENLVRGETATKANGVRTTGTLDLPIGVGEPYAGVDLTVKFADEITTAGNAWTWIKSRITSGDYSGIHLGDYIPFTATNGNQRDAKIIGIDTYTKYYSTEIGHHIDFWAGFWGQKAFNLAGYNNGTSVSSYPWLASDAYLFANSLSGSVPTSSSANPTLGARDHTSGGIYYYLPAALKNVIVEKKVLMGQRYTSGSLLTDDNNWGWTSIGKMWFPHEIEVSGMSHWTRPGFETGGFIQYPFFYSMANRLAHGRTQYWLLSPSSGNSTNFGCVSSYGNVSEASAVTSTVCYAPVCFRVA